MDKITKLNDELKLMYHRRHASNMLYMSREAEQIINDFKKDDPEIIRQIITTNPRKSNDLQ